LAASFAVCRASRGGFFARSAQVLATYRARTRRIDRHHDCRRDVILIERRITITGTD
jgi:hypothetical protein